MDQVPTQTRIKLLTHKKSKAYNEPSDSCDPMKEDPEVDMLSKIANFHDDDTEPMNKDIK